MTTWLPELTHQRPTFGVSEAPWGGCRITFRIRLLHCNVVADRPPKCILLVAGPSSRWLGFGSARWSAPSLTDPQKQRPCLACQMYLNHIFCLERERPQERAHLCTFLGHSNGLYKCAETVTAASSQAKRVQYRRPNPLMLPSRLEWYVDDTQGPVQQLLVMPKVQGSSKMDKKLDRCSY